MVSTSFTGVETCLVLVSIIKYTLCNLHSTLKGSDSMSRTVDRQYEDLLSSVLETGHKKSDRTGTGTLSLFGPQIRYDLGNGLPIITTKKVFFKAIVVELLWFLRGESNIRYLLDNGVKIWNEWADEDGELGPVYGVQWRSWPKSDGGSIDQISRALDQIKNNPDSRRIIVSAWNVAELPKMKLEPCHAFFQFYVADGRLSLKMYQRSSDMFLGVPFNVTSYSLLTHMMAQQAGLEVGDFIWTSGDTHVYSNHVDQVRTQLQREPRLFPTLNLRKAESIFDYQPEDFQLVDYRHHPMIKAPIAI